MPNFTEIEKHLDKVEFELNDAQMLIDEARHLPMQTTEFSLDLDVKQLQLNVHRAKIAHARNAAEYLRQ